MTKNNNPQIISSTNEAIKLIQSDVINHTKELGGEIETDTTNNAKATLAVDMHQFMAKFFIVSRLNTEFKKWYDDCKKDLDRTAKALGIDPEVESGESKTIYQNEKFSFSKKRNAQGTSVSLKDFVIELHKLGVDPDMIDKAHEAAVQTKEGNQYYSIDIAEGG